MYADAVNDAYGENAFAILAIVSKPLRRVSTDLADEFMKEAMSGDYDYLNQVALDYAERLDNDEIG